MSYSQPAFAVSKKVPGSANNPTVLYTELYVVLCMFGTTNITTFSRKYLDPPKSTEKSRVISLPERCECGLPSGESLCPISRHIHLDVLVLFEVDPGRDGHSEEVFSRFCHRHVESSLSQGRSTLTPSKIPPSAPNWIGRAFVLPVVG